MRLRSAGIAAPALLVATALAQSQGAAPAAEKPLKSFLQGYARNGHFEGDKTTRYFDAFVDLNSDGKKEVIVYLMGSSWCGSGGCITLILARDATSWRVVKKITITRPPIRVLSSTSHGWHNISVLVAGGGTEPAYESELRFDGKSYPGNPSVAPARRLNGKVPGEIVIPSMQGGTPLYP